MASGTSLRGLFVVLSGGNCRVVLKRAVLVVDEFAINLVCRLYVYLGSARDPFPLLEPGRCAYFKRVAEVSLRGSSYCPWLPRGSG